MNETIRNNLEQLFEEMVVETPKFKAKSYESVFMNCYEKYEKTFEELENLCADAAEEERMELVKEAAGVIPDYARGKMQALPKRKKEGAKIDYNLSMAVYVVPAMNYGRNKYCPEIAKEMVRLWNEGDVTTLKLGNATYEDISSGFKRKLCYITTAVCESRNKPDDCYELTLLRSYRDRYLLNMEEGRKLVDEYYEIAPGIVSIIEMHKDAKTIYESIYKDYLLPCISDIENGQNELCKERYVEMIRTLQKKYLYS